MGRNNKRSNRQLQPAASQCIKGAGAKPQMEKTLEELRKVLFRPLIFNNSSGRTIDFEHIQIPFLLKGSHLYTVMFLDSCGDTSIYTECYELENGNPFESYKDATELMKEVLEVEKTTGIPYYFGKIDKALETYLYGLQLFVDKEMLDRDKAVELARDLGFDTEAMLDMHQAVSDRIEETMKRREQRMLERKEQKTAADIMMQFLSDITKAGEEGETDEAD